MKTIIKYLNYASALATGFVISSLWYNHNDNWKISLPIALMLIVITQTISNEKNENT